MIVLSTVLVGCAALAGKTPTPLNYSTLPPPVVKVSTATSTRPSSTLNPPTAFPTRIASPTRMLPTGTPEPPVRVESFSAYSNYLGYNHVISVYLPGEYDKLPQKRYKVLYANDGQDLGEISFEIYMDSLIAAQQVEPLIVVAIQSNDNRLYEFGTGTVPSVDGWGILAQEYNNFIVRELKPEIDKKYRTLNGPQNTAFMGWSLGGLTAFYIVWQYPNEFGIVGAFSPSLWWRTNQDSVQDVLDSRVIHKLVRETGKRPGMRMWFEAGKAESLDDRDKNGVIDMIQDITNLMDELAKKGYLSETDMKLVVVPGGKHALATWVTVLPEFLRWAFPFKK